MDDRRIEDMLRECRTPKPPDGMRERVLRRSREELARQRTNRPLLWMSRWKLALASLGILVILATNISDYARQSRLSAMIDGSRPGMSQRVTIEKSLIKKKLEMNRLLVESPSGEYPFDITREGGSL